MNNGDLTELERQQMEDSVTSSNAKSILGKLANDFSSGFKQGIYGNNPDAKAIKDRINRSGNSNNQGNNRKNQKDKKETDDKSDKEDSLDKKDTSSEEKDKDNAKNSEAGEGKESKDKNDEKDSDKKEDSAKNDNDSKGEDEGAVSGTIKKVFGKVKKVVYIVIAIVIAFFGVVLFMALATYNESYLGSLSNLYGIPEATIEEDGVERSGLLTEEEYLFDDNGNPLSSQQLVQKLSSEQECKVTIWNTIGDKIFGGKSFKDRCALMREIQRQTEGTDVDKNLVISTLFYGYDTLPGKNQYKNNNVPENYVESIEHYKTLEQILSDENMGIDRQTIKTIINNSKLEKKEYYYEWVIEPKKNSSDEVVGKIGKCEKKYLPTSSVYDLTKWKVFMRFGEQAAEYYESEMTSGKSYSASSDECKGMFTESELLERVKNAPLDDGTGAGDLSYEVSSTVEEANTDLKTYKESNITPLLQTANIESGKLDSFNSYNGINLSYENGFAYNNFPGYAKSYNDPNIDVNKDSVSTPKEIEKTIQNIVSKKMDMNAALGIDDPDSLDSFLTDADMSSSVITGAHCGSYLTAGLNEIKVRLTDCHGNYLKTTTFEDYIIGVADAEVSNKNDDYVLSEMLAAISYALHRRNNYTKGTVITMKSGTCDQAYCSMLEGCHTQRNPEICSGCSSYYIGGSKGKYPYLYPKYKALYEKASAFLVVSNGKVHNCHYVSSIQNEWYRKAQTGMSFTQIIQETYASEGAQVVRCSDLDTQAPVQEQTEVVTRVGDKATNDYPKTSPDYGKFYGYSYADGNENEIRINEAWKNENLVTISPECSDSEFANMKFTVNKQAVDNFKQAFRGVCKIITEGVQISNGTTCKYTTNNLHEGTTFIERKTTSGAIDLHSYGISQDWNYSAKYIVGDLTYSPYSFRDLELYEEFVSALGGNEENCSNVNYILWKYAYKDAGFNWGGNYGRKGNSGTFDGKLFELNY